MPLVFILFPLFLATFQTALLTTIFPYWVATFLLTILAGVEIVFGGIILKLIGLSSIIFILMFIFQAEEMIPFVAQHALW